MLYNNFVSNLEFENISTETKVKSRKLVANLSLYKGEWYEPIRYSRYESNQKVKKTAKTKWSQYDGNLA